MLTAEIVNPIAIKMGLTKMNIAKYPTWIDKNHQEGIELVLGAVKPFWVVAGERNYIEPTGEHIKKIIGALNNETETPQKEEKPESKEDDKELVNTDNSLLPEFLTPALMSKWAKMTTTDRVLLFQKTPKDKVKSVEVGKDMNGNKVYAPYVEGNYMFKEANAAFLFDWYIDIKEVSISITGVGVRGTLFVFFSEYNKYLSRPATGYQELNKKVDAQLAQKGATTDAIKKGLSLFGFNSDVYSGEL